MTELKSDHRPTPDSLSQTFMRQKQSYEAHPMPSAKTRREDLARLKQVLITHQDAIADAISADYGNRSSTETHIGELMTCLHHIDYYQKHLTRWMRPSRRKISMLHQPAKGWVEYQPYGVVGIIAPWNYPLLLCIGPLICALAAGNRAMIKLSGVSQQFGRLLKDILSHAFDEVQVAVCASDDISEYFARLPFDLLVFTGSTAVGRLVMAQAAANLTPVILELGGKSPVIVHESVPMTDVAERLAFGKLWNAGQTCVAPDHVYLPRGKLDEFITCYERQASKMYPTLKDNSDYTSIIHDRQFAKLQSYLTDAKAKGANIIEINPGRESLVDTRKIPPTLVYGVTADMLLMQHEIFGPILPIIEYDDINAVINTINQGERPLALYYFDYDGKRADDVAHRTHSGHFGRNCVLTHVAQDDLPFGGVGASGMGKYHGPEGFFSFSHARSVMSSPKFYALRFIFPPFDRPLIHWLKKLFVR